MPSRRPRLTRVLPSVTETNEIRPAAIRAPAASVSQMMSNTVHTIAVQCPVLDTVAPGQRRATGTIDVTVTYHYACRLSLKAS
ncbi:ubiquinone biosynthesis protein [Streptomyces sp. NBRC 110611]|nr:ubiquinone biosynthesis protein [Streptomyces sp. NBRC 110611]